MRTRSHFAHFSLATSGGLAKEQQDRLILQEGGF